MRITRSRVLFAALADAVGILVLVLLLMGRSAPAVPPLRAAPQVAKVSAESLASSLLSTPFRSDEVPARTKALTGLRLINFRATGLVGADQVDLAGMDSNELVTLSVFDSPQDATNFYETSIASPGATGISRLPGVGDPSECLDTAQPASASAPASNEARCEVLTADTVIAAFADRAAPRAFDNATAASLATGAVLHVMRAANTLRAAHAGSALSASVLDAKLLASNPQANSLPVELTGPQSYSEGLGSFPPTGLVDTVETDFNGPDYADSGSYYVFDNAADAATFFDQGLSPPGSTPTAAVDGSGLSEPETCGDYSLPGIGASACFILRANVVIESYTSSNTNTQAGNDGLTVSMSRVLLFHLDQLDPAG